MLDGLGINSMQGWSIPFDERMRLIRQAGFDSVMLSWGGEETAARMEQAACAAENGLIVENVHAPSGGLNALWLPGDGGDNIVRQFQDCIRDCERAGIGTMVLHLTNGFDPPPPSATGMARVDRVVCEAAQRNVTLAFENARENRHLQLVLERYVEPFVALCYDAGHANCWAKGLDLPGLYGGRIAAVHLSDNTGGEDEHRLPFDGDIDWAGQIGRLKGASYAGRLTLEVKPWAATEYCAIPPARFLQIAHHAGLQLLQDR